MATDVAHEAIVRLLSTVEEGKLPIDPRAWLFRTARNLAVDEVRKRFPSPLGLEVQVLAPLPNEGQESPWDLGKVQVSKGDLLQLLPQALARLPEHYQRLIDAHYQEGLACEVVAERERISLANAKVRLFRARRRLRKILEDEAVGRRFSGQQPKT